jgi:DNA-directed RNA polymerase specialized sigma24 family protein
MLDVPIGTVKSRVFRATKALRKELALLGVDV